MVITGDDRWPQVFPRHHEMGQSRQALTLFPERDLYHPKGRMTIDEHRREEVELFTEAVNQYDSADLDCIESKAKRIERLREGLLITCMNGSQVLADRVFFAAGVGPELTLEKAIASRGGFFENQAGPKRLVEEEITTALRALGRSKDEWRGMSVGLFGGGATAAWAADFLITCGIKDLLWVAPNGFDSANPGNRNTDVLEATKDCRRKASILKVKYLGHPDAMPGDEPGVRLLIDDGSAQAAMDVDFAICAAGSDPMAPTGIRDVLGPLYHELIPAKGESGGVFASDRDRKLYVLSSSFADSRLVSMIQLNAFDSVLGENKVTAGLAVTALSATDAVADAARAAGGASNLPAKI